MTERYNGIKINQEKLSDEELYNLIAYTQVRRDEAESELVRLLELATERGLVSDD